MGRAAAAHQAGLARARTRTAARRVDARLPARPPAAGNTSAVTLAWRLTSFTLALLLTFRVNRSYDRWWTARQAFAGVGNAATSVATMATLWIKDDPALQVRRRPGDASKRAKGPGAPPAVLTHLGAPRRRAPAGRDRALGQCVALEHLLAAHARPAAPQRRRAAERRRARLLQRLRRPPGTTRELLSSHLAPALPLCTRACTRPPFPSSCA